MDTVVDKNKCAIVYHSADFDGKLSAAILYYKALQEGLTPVLCPYNHGQWFDPDSFEGADHIWIADISLPVRIMKILAESDHDVRWWDHHMSSYELAEKNGFDNLPGTHTRGGTGEPSAVLLVSRDCFPDDDGLQEIASMISVVDTHTVDDYRKYDDSRSFITGLTTLYDDNVISLVEDLPELRRNPKFVIQEGERIRNLEKGFRRGKSERAYMVTLPNGERCAVMTCAYGSPGLMGTFNDVCSYAMSIRRNQDNSYSVSMRSADGFSCPEMLRNLFGKGGGHPNAAGVNGLSLDEISGFLFPSPGKAFPPFGAEKAGRLDKKWAGRDMFRGVSKQDDPMLYDNIVNVLKKEFQSGVYPVTVNGEEWNCLLSGVLDGDVFVREVGGVRSREMNLRISPVPGSDRWEVCMYRVTADDHVGVVYDCLDVSADAVMEGLKTNDFTRAARDAELERWKNNSVAASIPRLMGPGWGLRVEPGSDRARIEFPMPDGSLGFVPVEMTSGRSVHSGYLVGIVNAIANTFADNGMSFKKLSALLSDEDILKDVRSRVAYKLKCTLQKAGIWKSNSGDNETMLGSFVEALNPDALFTVSTGRRNRTFSGCVGCAKCLIRWVEGGYEGPMPLHEGGVLHHLPKLPPGITTPAARLMKDMSGSRDPKLDKT